MKNSNFPSQPISISSDGRHLCIHPGPRRKNGLFYYFKNDQGNWEPPVAFAGQQQIHSVFVGIHKSHRVFALTRHEAPGGGLGLWLWEYKKLATGKIQWVRIQDIAAELAIPSAEIVTMSPDAERIVLYVGGVSETLTSGFRGEDFMFDREPLDHATPESTDRPFAVATLNVKQREAPRNFLCLASERGKKGFYFGIGDKTVTFRQEPRGLYFPKDEGYDYRLTPPAWNPSGDFFYLAMEIGGVQEYEVTARSNPAGPEAAIDFRDLEGAGYLARETRIAGIAPYRTPEGLPGLMLLDEYYRPLNYLKTAPGTWESVPFPKMNAELVEA